MNSPPPVDPVTQRALDGCAAQLRTASRSADEVAGRVGATLGGTATGIDRQLVGELRRLASELYAAAIALSEARGR